MRFLRDQGLAITMFGIFAVTMVGLVLTGWNNYNGEQIEHSMPTITLAQYLTTPSFGEAVFENWESEFLQMGAYVLLTAFLFSAAPPSRRTRTTRAPSDDGSPPGDPTTSLAGSAGGIDARALRALAGAWRSFGCSSRSFVLHAVERRRRVQRGAAGPRRSSGLTLEYLGTARSSGSSRSRTGRASSWPSSR